MATAASGTAVARAPPELIGTWAGQMDCAVVNEATVTGQAPSFTTGRIAFFIAAQSTERNRIAGRLCAGQGAESYFSGALAGREVIITFVDGSARAFYDQEDQSLRFVTQHRADGRPEASTCLGTVRKVSVRRTARRRAADRHATAGRVQGVLRRRRWRSAQ
ncbi:MAG: hypothetical protein M5U09_08525 [Gammaproteobacteria bacterium]|nr:hypothetical protein [Gammaproteobacteria bacterium]